MKTIKNIFIGAVIILPLFFVLITQSFAHGGNSGQNYGWNSMNSNFQWGYGCPMM